MDMTGHTTSHKRTTAGSWSGRGAIWESRRWTSLLAHPRKAVLRGHFRCSSHNAPRLREQLDYMSRVISHMSPGHGPPEGVQYCKAATS